MRRLLLLSLILLPTMALARQAAQGDCVLGGKVVVTNGLNSTTKVLASYPSCTVQVNIQGGGLATIYSDNNSTILANPFTATTGGHWQWYADNGHYSVLISGGTPQAMPSSFTYSDILLDDNAQSSTTVCGLGFNASITFTAAACSDFTLTLTGNVTSSTVTGAVTGQQLNISLCQDATGSRTFAWPPSFTRPPTISAVAGSCTNTQFFFDGAAWRQTAATGDALIAGNGGTLSGVFNGNPTLSGNLSLTGISTYSGAGAITGSVGGNPTWTGNHIYIGTAPITTTGDNPVLFGGSMSAKRAWNIRYADQFCGGSTDLSVCVANAKSDLGTSSGTIFVPPKADGSCWLWTAPLVYSTLGQYISLRGLAQGGNNDSTGVNACVIVTRTIAGYKTIQFNNAANAGGVGHNPATAWIAIQNLTVWNATADGGSTPCLATGGCGSLATFVDCSDGTTSGGCYEALFDNVSVNGFGKVWSNLNNYSVQITWRNSHFAYNTQIAQLGGSAAGQQLSGIVFEGGQWAGNGAGIVGSTGTTPEVKLSHVISFGWTGLFIDYTTTGLGSRVDVDDNHIEGGGNSELISGNMDLHMKGGSLGWDFTGGTHDWIVNTTGNFLDIDGTTIAAPGVGCPTGCLTTGIVNANGGNPEGKVYAYLASPGHFNTAGTVGADIVVAGTKAAFFEHRGVYNSSLAQMTHKFPTTILAPGVEVGTGAGFICDEDGAPGGQANKSVFYCDSTSHRWRMNLNNAGFQDVVGISTTDILTNKTLTTPVITTPAINGGLANNGTGVQHKRGVAGCTTAAAAGANCTTIVTWNTSFADTSYTAVCTGDGIASGVPLHGGLTAKAAASVTFQTIAATTVAAGYTNIECVGFHD